MSKIIYDLFDWESIQPSPVVGVDEVGRGCLAGPVVAGAAILLSKAGVQDLTDSKLLSEKQRDRIASQIETEHLVSIGVATVVEIEELNILQASLLAMTRAVQDLEKKFSKKLGHLLVDGTFKVPNVNYPQTTLIKGDLRAAPISAAAIVAKVYRDRLMTDLDQSFPLYGFKKHKGYPSPFHKKAIQENGPTTWHRRTFKGVSEFV